MGQVEASNGESVTRNGEAHSCGSSDMESSAPKASSPTTKAPALQRRTDSPQSDSGLTDSDDGAEAAKSAKCGGVRQEEELQREWNPEEAPPSPIWSDNGSMIGPQRPEHRGRLTVVLDLDETLVRFRTGAVHWRPGYAEFLDAIKGCCEVVLWTAATVQCAQNVVRELDPHGDRLHYTVYRNSTWFHGVPYTKDLTLLGRDMSRVIIVENSVQSCYLNPQHAIIVSDYTTPDPKDMSLHVVRDVIVGASRASVTVPRYLANRRDALIPCQYHVGAFLTVTQAAQRRKRIERAQLQSTATKTVVAPFRQGDRVRVRDSPTEPWRVGVVSRTDSRGAVYAIPDEWSGGTDYGFTFKFCEHSSQRRGKRANE